MKLRNVITKEIWNIPEWRTPAVQEGDICFFAELNGDGKLFSYKSLDELNKEWQDYKPKEPLIKDKKIRKAVRAWWESIPLEAADKLVLYKKNQDLAVGVYTIYCGAIYPDDTLKTGKYYTIAELCGEEEE